MGRKIIPGLVQRAGIWHVDKRICRRRVCQSTGSRDLQEAQTYLARLMEQMRQAEVYGVRPPRTFEQAAAKFVLEHQHKRSLYDDISRLKHLMPWIGNCRLDQIHVGTLRPWIDRRLQDGVATGTINHGLAIVRRILNLAGSEWVDEHGLTWLATSPTIKLLAVRDRQPPWPLTWEEQDRLFAELPTHLREMAIFAVNTGLRDREICRLRWDWEVVIPALNASVFIIPGTQVKNGDERLVVLNATAVEVVQGRRAAAGGTHVFAYEGRPLDRMLTSAWKRARVRAGLPQVRVHDLRHTFGRRLRAAGVSFEDRQDLLGHRSARVTTHYSAAELARLLEAVNKVCARGNSRPDLLVLKGRLIEASRKTYAGAGQASA